MSRVYELHRVCTALLAVTGCHTFSVKVRFQLKVHFGALGDRAWGIHSRSPLQGTLPMAGVLGSLAAVEPKKDCEVECTSSDIAIIQENLGHGVDSHVGSPLRIASIIATSWAS